MRVKRKFVHFEEKIRVGNHPLAKELVEGIFLSI